MFITLIKNITAIYKNRENCRLPQSYNGWFIRILQAMAKASFTMNNDQSKVCAISCKFTDHHSFNFQTTLLFDALIWHLYIFLLSTLIKCIYFSAIILFSMFISLLAFEEVTETHGLRNNTSFWFPPHYGISQVA